MFNNKKVKELEEKVDVLSNLLSDFDSKIEELENSIKSRELIAKEIATKNDEPWAGFSVSEVTHDGRVGIELDWNPQFIEYLKRNGINAGTPEEAVGIWFASLMKTMGEEISEEQAEKIRNSHRLKD